MMWFILWIFSFIPTFFIYLGLSLGVVLYFFSELASSKLAQLIPSNYLTPVALRISGIAIMVVSIFLLGVSFSVNEFKSELEKKNAEIIKINEKAKDITNQVEIKYVYRDKIIKEKGDEIIKYVNIKNDADCNLHNSTIELLNAAAKNNLPDPTRAIDETGSGVKLSTVEGTVIGNYNKYHEIKNQLTLLQEWITEQWKNNK